ncbi:uncharacterized protein LOC129720580 [Wyeomyia smithii]|uniref:uncharacterized protein LOC129720580 n=1 Tax=Wyeomyia smithii TaxID=174621 RepID=UPI0024681062|nr:uncharacterized protein LOC129720580 [Wyeomyia smithii]
MEPTSASKLRGKNWTIEEDEALCTVWLNVSTDAMVGINQNTENLYNRIYENFIEICTAKVVSSNPELRASKGIKARWHQINKTVCKFAGCIAQITNQQQSGAPPEDIFKQALTLLASTEHSSFSLMHCFKILESAPKWQQYNVKETSMKRKLTVGSETNFGGNDYGNGKLQTSEERPKGQKTGKQQLKHQHMLDSTASEIANATKLLAQVAQEKLTTVTQRNFTLSRMVDHSVMSIDFSKLSEHAKEYYMLEQRLILKETQSKILANNVTEEEYSMNIEVLLSEE